MKYFALIAGLIVLISAQQCKTSSPPKSTVSNSNSASSNTANYSETTAMLQTTWLHSYEEDTDGAKAYRPNSFNFPPSRGRTGFAFEKGGKFIQYDIAPTDGLEGKEGTWKMKNAKTISVAFPTNSGMSPYDLEIISLDKNKLLVRPTEQ